MKFFSFEKAAIRVMVAFVAIFSVTSSHCLAQVQVQPPTRPYLATSYNITLDWRNVFNNSTQVFSGMNEIALTLIDTTSAIVLDAQEMRIDSIRINGVSAAAPAVISDSITIAIPPSDRDSGAQITLDVWYTHTANYNDPESGMYFYAKGDSSQYQYVQQGVIPESLAYTMSEPNGTRKWVPCNDEPYNKVNSQISIIVPAGYSAQSNGALLSVDTNGADGSLTFHWQSDRLIATYLMVAYASKWVTWRNYYHRLSNPSDSIPVIYYAWAEDYNTTDTTGDTYNAQFAFRHTVDLIANDSKLFGEYPFNSYSQVPLDSFYFGGMEHQTITALERPALTGREESVIAHELFHHWFGDKTTCQTWADIWLNEGFATFGEMLWAEQFNGMAGYNAYVQNIADNFFYYAIQDNLQAPTYNPPVDQMFNFPYVAVVYYKPGCMLHMLRRMLNNDSLFFNTLRDYSSAFAYTTANTFQFRDFIAQRDDSLSPVELKTFIDEWIFQPDWPIYNIRWNVSGNQLLVQIDQSQDSTDHYTMPLRFKEIASNDTTNIVLLNNARNQSFSEPLTEPLQNLIIDTSAIIISNLTIEHDPTLAVSASGAVSWMLDANVANGIVKLSYTPIVSEGAGLRIVDVLGRTIYERELMPGNDLTTLPATEFSSGDYFVTLSDGRNLQSAKFHLER